MTEGLRWKVTKAVRASSLPSPAKLIMLTLADISDVGTAEIPERFTPSLTVLARETSLGRSTVAMHLLALEGEGWIVRTRPETAQALGQGERTRYQLKVPPHVPSPAHELPSAGDEPPSAAPEQPSAGAEQPSAGAGHRDRSSSDLDQISTDHPSSATQDVAIPDRPDVDQVCRHLADRIEANGSKRPTISKAWRDAARRLIDRDGRTVEQIIRAIDWCQEDTFWRPNIMSMPKLREKYDQLRLAAQRGNGRNGHQQSTADKRVASALALAAKYAEQDAS